MGFVRSKRKYYKYTYTDWTQPTLSANGTVGGDSFACRANSTYTGYDTYKAFDNSSTTAWAENTTTNSGYLEFYSPVKLKVSKITIQNRHEYTNTWASGVVYGSLDGTDYYEMATFTNSNVTASSSWDINITNQQVAKYIKISTTSLLNSSHTLAVAQMTLTAQEAIPVESTINDYDYYEYESLKNYILTRTEISDWTQPVLKSNGDIYGSRFACTESSYYTESDGREQRAWRLFSGDSTGEEWQINSVSTSSTYWATFYNPNPLKISALQVQNGTGSFSPTKLVFQGSNDNSTWTTLGTTTNNNTTTGDLWNATIDTTGWYKYYRIVVTPRTTTSLQVARLKITAEEMRVNRYLFARKKKLYYKYQDWTQPVLSANGTMGGDSFAVSQSSYNNTGNEAYQVFNNDNKSWQSKAYDTNPQWLTFYNPKPLKLEKIKIYNITSETVYYPKGMYIQGSNDNSTWETLYTYTGTSYVAEITCEVSSDKAYKYHRIYIYDRAYFDSENCFAIITDVEITAQEAIGIYVDNGNIYKDWIQPINPSGISATSGWTDPTKAFDGNSSTYTECGTVTDYIEWDLGTDILLSSVTATGYWVNAVVRACNMIIKSVDSYGSETTLGVTTGSADTTTYSLTTSFSETVVNKLRFYLTTNHLNAEPSTQYPTRIREINLTAREFVKTGDTIDDYDYIKYEDTKFY